MGQGAKIWVGEKYQRMQELRKGINAKNKSLQTPQDIKVIDTGHFLMWGVVAWAILTLLIRKMRSIILRIWEHKGGCQAGFHSPGFQSLFLRKGSGDQDRQESPSCKAKAKREHDWGRGQVHGGSQKDVIASKCGQWTRILGCVDV